MFDRLKEELLPLIAAAGAADDGDDIGAGPFPEDGSVRLSLAAMTAFGFDPQSFRLDSTVHPFCSAFATTDIRVTTRYARG